MIFDVNPDSGLPPWDFEVEFRGKTYSVKLPTAEQRRRLASVDDTQYLGALIDLLSELAGIDREELGHCDALLFLRAMGILSDALMARDNAVAKCGRGKLNHSPVTHAVAWLN